MTRVTVTWHGNAIESAALIAAISHNCGCIREPLGNVRTPCGPHAALLTDQRWLDAILFYRHLRRQLIMEDFDLDVLE